ncbi:MAG: TatD family hydrolase [Candidatus Aureabacteria bacterium]|nr:TatD family hydrolase [Candidatus Auribacterota bacterium]
MLIDTHAHLTDKKFGPDLEEVIARAAEQGVGAIIDVGDSLVSSMQCIEHATRNAMLFASVGIHPNNAEQASADDLRRITDLADAPRVVAIGETGLDFYRHHARHDVQEELFKNLLRVAARKRLPVIMHCRDAYKGLLPLLGEMRGDCPNGVLHCFSGEISDAEAIIGMGFSISLGGPLTYPGNVGLREIARRVPIERILLETDCPYLPPQGKRGKRNEPANVALVAEALAGLRGMTVAEIAEVTSGNAKRLFGKMCD